MMMNLDRNVRMKKELNIGKLRRVLQKSVNGEAKAEKEGIKSAGREGKAEVM